MAYVRTVKPASGARAVQIVHSSRRGSRDIEHIGSAHDDAALEALKAVARQRLAVGQPELDFGPDFAALQAGSGAGGDEVFRLLVLARIVEPTSKLDSLRVVEEGGFDPPAYATLKRRLPAFAKESWRQKSAAACARTADLGPASLVLYDVFTLYFETDARGRVP